MWFLVMVWKLAHEQVEAVRTERNVSVAIHL